MKKINYFNRELKVTKFKIEFDKEDKIIPIELTDNDYEIKELTIEVEDSQLDYYLDIINKSYGKFGVPIVTDVTVAAAPTLEERLASMESMLTILMGV